MPLGVKNLASSGEVAGVTGSTGIGRAVTLKLAERGCEVAVQYNRSEAEARGGRKDRSPGQGRAPPPGRCG